MSIVSYRNGIRRVRNPTPLNSSCFYSNYNKNIIIPQYICSQIFIGIGVSKTKYPGKIDSIYCFRFYPKSKTPGSIWCYVRPKIIHIKVMTRGSLEIEPVVDFSYHRQNTSINRGNSIVSTGSVICNGGISRIIITFCMKIRTRNWWTEWRRRRRQWQRGWWRWKTASWWRR